LSRSEKKSALDYFLQGIKAEATRKKYTRTLRRILCDYFEELFEGDFEQRANELVKTAKEDPDWVKDLLLSLSKKVKLRTELRKDHDDYLNPSSFDSYFKPIKKLFDMNDVSISWKRIYSTYPEIDNSFAGRGWTRQEIQKMLNFANGAVDRAIVLIAASSGIRSGAFDLDWEDVTPIYKIGDELKVEITESEQEQAMIVCAMLKIYNGTNSQYPAFITVEAYLALQDHKLEWAREVKREPKPREPIFKKEGSLPKRASSASIKKRVERMAQKAGLRPPLAKGQKRYEVPIMNGFRRFCNKTYKEALSRDSPLASLIKIEFMMGHGGLIKLDRNYFKTHTLELAEQYLSATTDLTISDEFRLRTENTRLRSERERFADTDIIKNMMKRLEEVEKKEKRQDDLFEDVLIVEKDLKKNAMVLNASIFNTIRPEDIDKSLKNEFEKNRKRRFFEEIARRN